MSETVVIGLGSSKIHPLAYIAKQPIDNIALHLIDTVQHTKVPAGVDIHLIGKHLVNGVGCGGDAALGQKAAEENIDLLWELIPKKGRVAFMASMSGGTGAGLLPTMLRLATEKKSITASIVTMPLIAEGKARTKIAAGRLKALQQDSNQIEVIKQATLQPFLPEKVFIDESRLYKLLNLTTAWKAISHLF